MDGLIILAGIVWVIYQLAKDAAIKQVPEGTDATTVLSDRYSGKYTDKEIDRRIYIGYYVTKDK